MRRRLWRGTPRGAVGPAAVERWHRGEQQAQQTRADLAAARVHLILVDRGAPMGAAEVLATGRARWGRTEFGVRDTITGLVRLEREHLVTHRRHRDGSRRYEVAS